jgi:hypothetical protein
LSDNPKFALARTTPKIYDFASSRSDSGAISDAGLPPAAREQRPQGIS